MRISAEAYLFLRMMEFSISKLFGMELEFFLLNHEGKIANKAAAILRDSKRQLKEIELKKECGQSMLEVASFPHMSSREIFGNFFRDFESLVYELENNELGIYYYGSYPGKNTTRITEDRRYFAKERILGKKEFENARKCIGFHYHYSLPRKSFNLITKYFYIDLKEIQQQKILNLYNLYVALDPAITTFMQSSPYYESRLEGKDGRVIAYRGDSEFGYENSLYSRYPEFGMLNSYKPTFKAVSESTLELSRKWSSLLKIHNLTRQDFAKKEFSLLDSSWKPVKITSHATIESRGSDMNTLNNVVAMTSVLNSLSKFVQNNKVRVVPGEAGSHEPFKLEDNELYVPDMATLKLLEKESAFYGFESEKVYRYCKSLLSLVKKITTIEMRAPIKNFMEMLYRKETKSDEIINFVKKRQGYTNFSEIEEKTAREFAVKTSESIFKDIIITKKMADKSMIYF